MKVIVVLGLLVISLVILIPLLERFQGNWSKDAYHKIGRWILPLVMMSLVVQLLYALLHGE
ncbi:hypothetical protein ACFOEE_00900 [Pseudoalteromonas fenneropenaei]|uniref:Uncharacterized protein n=1 Tax=Pseudoalteromonas fenneropenaei TaxID=1737459 RepID=A0ABV7CEL8_9GAMM